MIKCGILSRSRFQTEANSFINISYFIYFIYSRVHVLSHDDFKLKLIYTIFLILYLLHLIYDNEIILIYAMDYFFVL